MSEERFIPQLFQLPLTFRGQNRPFSGHQLRDIHPDFTVRNERFTGTELAQGIDQVTHGGRGSGSAWSADQVSPGFPVSGPPRPVSSAVKNGPSIKQPHAHPLDAAQHSVLVGAQTLPARVNALSQRLSQRLPQRPRPQRSHQPLPPPAPPSSAPAASASPSASASASKHCPSCWPSPGKQRPPLGCRPSSEPAAGHPPPGSPAARSQETTTQNSHWQRWPELRPQCGWNRKHR